MFEGRFTSAALAGLFVLMAASMLAACGGGGGSTGESAPSRSGQAHPATTDSGVSPSCSGCAALSPTQYAGHGVGIWEKTNGSASAQDVPVYIAGLNGQPVTLVFSNESGHGPQAPAAPKSSVPAIAGAAPSPHEAAQEFNRTGWKNLSATLASKPRPVVRKAAPAPDAPPALNDARAWLHTDGSERRISLVGQRAAGDGMVFNVWVENGHFGAGRVDTAIVQTVLQGVARSGGIYEAIVALGGPLWGPHDAPTRYLPAGRQWVDIVLLDFGAGHSADQGYFWGLNNYLGSTGSNESLALVLNAPNAATLDTRVTLSNVAHELTHMQNFYRRNVAAGGRGSFDTWLEEMTAMMAEDFVSMHLSPVFNSIREGRLPTYLAGNYNCPMLQFSGDDPHCESYSVAGTFGGYLLRQHGTAFFKDLLTRAQHADSQVLVDEALRASVPSSSFGQAFRRFAVTAGALLGPDAPGGYGFPAWHDAQFSLIPINPSDWAWSRQVPPQLPGEIASYGSVPLVRPSAGTFYSEVVRVPAGTTLSVVIR